MAEIEGLTNNWSAKASAMDSFQRVNDKDAYIALWIDPEGVIRWDKSNMTFEKMASISAILESMVNEWADRLVNEDG